MNMKEIVNEVLNRTNLTESEILQIDEKTSELVLNSMKELVLKLNKDKKLKLSKEELENITKHAADVFQKSIKKSVTEQYLKEFNLKLNNDDYYEVLVQYLEKDRNDYIGEFMYDHAGSDAALPDEVVEEWLDRMDYETLRDCVLWILKKDKKTMNKIISKFKK